MKTFDAVYNSALGFLTEMREEGLLIPEIEDATIERYADDIATAACFDLDEPVPPVEDEEDEEYVFEFSDDGLVISFEPEAGGNMVGV